MKTLRRIIQQMILEAFTQQDVEDAMVGDTRQRANQKSLFGSHAKDLFRQQREADPNIDEFLKSVITIHWKPVKTGEFSKDLDDDLIMEPLKNTSTKDELSCTPYMNTSEIADKGWHVGRDNMLGIEVEGWITWLEHGDAQTGHGSQREATSSSGANKQPRRTYMGRDPGKGNRMADVIQSVEDYENWDTLSTYGDGEALVDNWTPVRVWYKGEFDQMQAWQAAKMLGKRFNKQIPFQCVKGHNEQWDYTDFWGSMEGYSPNREWNP